MNKTTDTTGKLTRLRDFDRRNSELADYSRNLNREVLEGKIGPVYNREGILDSVQKILLRRNKPNVLLTGAAGCGKTAIAEGLAQRIVKTRLAYLAETEPVKRRAYDEAYSKYDSRIVAANFAEEDREKMVAKPLFCDSIIYELSMNALLSGTKYRGEFEEKLQNILEIVAKNKNIILFIDEIHQMNVIGNAEGASGMGQIMKPALARGELRVIGATTTEEAWILKKDKALARRFSEVHVPQLGGDAAIECLGKIMADYATFHGVEITGVTAATLYREVTDAMPDSVFPNNVIDVIDETLASARFSGVKAVGMAEINQTISRIACI